MGDQVELNILGNKSTTQEKIVVAIMLLSFVFIFITIFIKGYLFIIISFALFLIAGVIGNVVELAPPIGTLSLAVDYITIKTDNQETRYSTSELQNLKINYTDYNDEIKVWGLIRPHVSFGSGMDNYVSFDQNGIHHKYKVLIQKYDLSPINYIIDSWYDKDISIIIEKKNKKIYRLF